METGELIKLLASFTSGELSISEFQETIDELLFDLCLSPSMSAKKEFLSTIQLYLHEIDEGFREEFEMHMLVRSILDRYLTLLRKAETKYYPLVPPASQSGTVEPEPSYEKIAAIP